MPHVVEPGDAATWHPRAATGATNVFTDAVAEVRHSDLSQGPVPSPRRGNGRIFPLVRWPGHHRGLPTRCVGAGGVQSRRRRPSDNTLPAYMEPIRPLLNASVSKDYFSVLDFGSRFPIFGPPGGIRSARSATALPTGNFFFIGTFTCPGLRIGLIRIPFDVATEHRDGAAQLDAR